jgi:hypothetical protein
VQVDLSLSAYSNAAAHHTARKKQQAKQEKTLAAHAEAFKAAQKKAAAQLANLRNAGPAATVRACVGWGPHHLAVLPVCGVCVCVCVCVWGGGGDRAARSAIRLHVTDAASAVPRWPCWRPCRAGGAQARVV